MMVVMGSDVWRYGPRPATKVAKVKNVARSIYLKYFLNCKLKYKRTAYAYVYIRPMTMGG